LVRYRRARFRARATAPTAGVRLLLNTARVRETAASARFRVATNGVRFRLERLERRWFGWFGRLVWRPTPDANGEWHHYLTYTHAAAALREVAAKSGEIWEDGEG
jgi:hypothetical protein